ncbi:tRNA dimethylallyltransferase [Desulfolithobacter dissulfuricans]|uniref:tRNA dimethylallyltransferase n=1 Tax=Desulfolithobacter dissulfuricans TaxID=2795293 RepID=A0A915UA45_9BACT|nr:tRNA (adenosine(37)-N6)-dimethylallyltransferase MiaA [Desulfolithobacter dissulfuricans]BCO09080.1 tRNA dimethylallyltransferase [Desulfolithobacter dissulfuricans]
MTPLPINEPVLVLIGPTAIGKTDLSLEIADRFGCEIISMDSMQVYRYMDIGTAKVSAAEMARVTHHLIDIINPDEQYDAARFVHDALEAVDRIRSRNRIPLLTGGTGLYLKSLVHGLFDILPTDNDLRDRLRQRLQEEGREALFSELAQVDPETAKRIHPNDSQRLLRGLEIFYLTSVPWSVHLRNQRQQQERSRFTNILQLGLRCERDLLYERIGRRTTIMLDQGLIEEVEQLRRMGYGPKLGSMQSIGYRHANRYIDGIWDAATMQETLVRDTRRYAKRQMTWFTAQKDIEWFERTRTRDVLARIEVFLAGCGGPESLAV